MHELGIVFEVLKRVKEVVEINHIEPEDVAAVVLEIGEASTVVPKFMEECWPAAIDQTPYNHVELKIEIEKAQVECKSCHRVYEYLSNNKACPDCGHIYATIVTGDQFNLKEILLYEQ